MAGNTKGYQFLNFADVDDAVAAAAADVDGGVAADVVVAGAGAANYKRWGDGIFTVR